MLIKAGANIELHDTRNGDTPLHVAAESGSISSVKVLLDSGADAGAINKANKLPIDLAKDQGSN